MKNKNQWCLSNQLNKQVKSIQTWLNKSRCIELTLQVKFPVAYWALIPKDFSAVQKHISTYIRNTYTHRTRKNFKHVLVSRSYISYIFLLFLVGNIWNKNTYTKMKFCLLLCVLLHISLESVYGKNSSYIFFYYYFFISLFAFLFFLKVYKYERHKVSNNVHSIFFCILSDATDAVRACQNAETRCGDL